MYLLYWIYGPHTTKYVVYAVCHRSPLNHRLKAPSSLIQEIVMLFLYTFACIWFDFVWKCWHLKDIACLIKIYDLIIIFTLLYICQNNKKPFCYICSTHYFYSLLYIRISVSISKSVYWYSNETYCLYCCIIII